MAPSATQSLGSERERQACRYLQARGLRCLRRNFRCRFGELDLIMQDDRCLVIVEVRYRAGSRFTSAALSIGLSKQRKIIRATSLFLGYHSKLANYPLRFDIVAIDGVGDEQKIQWLKDAFRP